LEVLIGNFRGCFAYFRLLLFATYILFHEYLSEDLFVSSA